ncbi:DUF2695 domain-containing protein [Micromonospora zamorensis]|uniref:DUF2695 domain-containing protein n=1 Tax=Micromonospora zamorensis TaxID=709883 RepID=UPI0036C93544
MASPNERSRRKQLRDAYKNADREARSALLPIDRDQLAALVEFVDAHVLADGCDHTTRHGQQWADEQGIRWEALGDGLRQLGGWCDCEIVMNCHPEEIFR